MKLWIPVVLLACCVAGCQSTEGLQAISPVSNVVHFTGEYYQPGEVDQPPVSVLQVPPNFPRIMQKARIDGKVIIEMIVDAKGVPQQVQVAQATHPLYVEPALNAVRQWRYRPALKNGQPVASQLTVPLEFRRDTSLDIIPEH